MAATIEKERTVAEVMNWTLLNDTASATPWLETSQIDISADVICIVHIDMAQCNTEAIGTEAKFIVWGSSGSTDDDWHKIVSLGYGTTASNKIDFSKGVTSGEISVGIGDTTGIATQGKSVFIYDTSTLGNSQLNTLVDFSANVALFLLDGASRDYSTEDDILCPTATTGNGVSQWNVEIPEFWAAKVTFHNTDADANYACRVQRPFVTDYTSV